MLLVKLLYAANREPENLIVVAEVDTPTVEGQGGAITRIKLSTAPVDAFAALSIVQRTTARVTATHSRKEDAAAHVIR